MSKRRAAYVLVKDPRCGELSGSLVSERLFRREYGKGSIYTSETEPPEPGDSVLLNHLGSVMPGVIRRESDGLVVDCISENLTTKNMTKIVGWDTGFGCWIHGEIV